MKKELTDGIASALVEGFIKEEVNINGSIKVYFYATQKPNKPNKPNKDNKGESSKNGKCCCC